MIMFDVERVLLGEGCFITYPAYSASEGVRTAKKRNFSARKPIGKAFKTKKF